MYNPLLETNVRERTWYDIAEELQECIARAALRSKPDDAKFHLNVLDLIDAEASAYWRATGWKLYNARKRSGGAT